MLSTEAMSLICAMMLWSDAILLYSPTCCCASKNASKGCPRRTSNRNARKPPGNSSESPTWESSVEDSGSVQSVMLSISSAKSGCSAKSGTPRSYRSHGRTSKNVCRMGFVREN
ncbi:uncharacterized protein F5891DRAFT_1042663 [Suillus fuscotomentosus]|uniref:Secreted protein n=1 Tax=Suillus fuscotomentosus TaxID=1912939 RepID=A0AAD4HKA4_9AGAM|nr:uncharacterized protein F5891DRAFT_1042663 [Suillus fuscotomentosus]KAG1898589.1 hypothetical protein F5891DRAFT_1042663 [Suillus fuscotomentosus]